MAASRAKIHSMTGFASIEDEVGTNRFRVEIKALNHRFLDVKLRVPRELSSFEIQIRNLIQSKFSRGSVELKIERIQDPNTAPPQVSLNLALGAHYYESLITLQKTLGLTDAIRTTDIAGFPDVLARAGSEATDEKVWPMLQPVLENAFSKLTEMRGHEGAALDRVLREAVQEMTATIQKLRERRTVWAEKQKAKTTEKIRGVFEAYPLTAVSGVQSVLETRIAQELAMILDRTDIEEELTRFHGHLDHFTKILGAGGPVGRKLDFILQELNREINTLGNKAQDLQISEEVVQVKVRLEQLREQVMNLE